jgi:hypothetical protein
MSVDYYANAGNFTKRLMLMLYAGWVSASAVVTGRSFPLNAGGFPQARQNQQ